MRVAEAQWIARQLAELPIGSFSPLLNIGSSTSEYRERKQPHIEQLLFRPLRAEGVEIIHTDLKELPGVDIVGDLLDAEVQTTIRARRPKAALCSNLLEHVLQPDTIAKAIRELLLPDAYLVVTVPRSYPFHADPIDTGFRPAPNEIAALFPASRMVRGEIVEDISYGRELLRERRRGVRNVLGALRPRGDVARAQRDRLRWLFRPFTVSCVLLQATAS